MASFKIKKLILKDKKTGTQVVGEIEGGGAGLEYLDSVPAVDTAPNLFTVDGQLYFKGKVLVPEIYGVDGVGAASYTLTRTDLNVGLTSSSQDLHDFFVANEDVVDSNGNHFVALKKFYMKVSTNADGSQKWQVSNTKVDDDYFLCPFFYDKDGNVVEIAYYGKYKGSVSSNILKSVPSAAPKYNTTGDNFRTYARNNGSVDYHQTDWAAVLLAQCMFMIVYATTKYDSVFTMRSYGNTTGTNTQTFFGIEDMVGNGLEFVDGITYSNGVVYYQDLIKNYVGQLTSGYSISGISTNSSGDYQKTKMNISGKPVSLIFPQTLGGSETTYLCDKFYGSTSTNKSTWWGSYGSYASNGMFYLDCLSERTYTDSISGARLFAKTLI